MKFCSRCGNKILKGDKFCTKCGEEQYDDELVQKKIWEKNNEEPFHNKKDENVIWEIKKILLNILVQPVDTSKEFIEVASKNTVKCLTIFITIIQGILGIWSTNMLFSNFKNIEKGFIKQIPKFNQFSDFNIEHSMINTKDIIEMKSLFKIPYGKIFINNSIMLLIAVLITFLVVYVGINMLLKTKIDHWKVYKIAVISILPIIYFELFSILASYISLNIGIMLFIIGIVISISTLVIVIKDKIEINDNHCVFITAICTVVVLGMIFSLNIRV